MQNVRVELGDRSYLICIARNILGEIGQALKEFRFSDKITLVSNPTVYQYYGATVKQSLEDSGFTLSEILIPDGEEYKNLSWVGKIYDEMLRTKLDRRSALIALGGGVIGDITGFAASTYMRGIDFIQIPTTLLAQVDSSVGGKTGVNHELGKNMIGTFWQPRLVWIDLETLNTLPKREFLSGLAEVIKYGVIWDEELFSFLESHREGVLQLDRDCLTHIIKRSCEIKSEVVSKDEREAGLRAILNYGHTVGHAIETITGYRRYLHGEAIAIGMYAEAYLSYALGLLDQVSVGRIKAIISQYGLPSAVERDLDVKSMVASMQLDKKAVSGDMKFVLPERIGSVTIQAGIAAEKLHHIIRSISS